MDFAGIKKQTETAIVDPAIRDEARRYSLRTRLAFLPDRAISESWFFRLLTLIYYNIFIYFHGFEMIGTENVNPNEGCLFIARHSTHNGEILGTIVSMYHASGRVPRSLVHRYITPFFPVVRLMGSVPGEPETALSLLKCGFWVVVVPGGADEGMIGHENAYKVCWPTKRKGFARVAAEADVPIVPLFLENVEEMRWNPFLFFWNLLGLGRLFTCILKLEIPIVTPFLVLLGSTVWFIVTFFQIPIPAKITLHVGKPVRYDKTKDSIDDLVERSRRDLQNLIDRYQPQGKSYKRAVQQRLQSLIKYWQKRIPCSRHH